MHWRDYTDTRIRTDAVLPSRFSRAFHFKRLSRSLVQSSLRCSRLEGKGKGVLGARETRGQGRAPRVSLSPKTPFPFPFKRLSRRLSSKTAMNLIFTYPDIIYKQTSIAGSGYLNLGSFPHKYGNFEIQGEIKKHEKGNFP